MYGSTMIARISPAASTLGPYAGPAKNGVAPRCSVSRRNGITCSRMSGTRTNTPHSPYTTLGIAASRSMRKETGWRSQLRRELGEEDRAAERERRGDHQRDDRGEDRADDGRRGAELAGDRIPDAGGQEAEAELPQRRPSGAAHLEEDEEEQNRHAEREGQDRAAIDAVGDDRALDGGQAARRGRRARDRPLERRAGDGQRTRLGRERHGQVGRGVCHGPHQALPPVYRPGAWIVTVGSRWRPRRAEGAAKGWRAAWPPLHDRNEVTA